MRQHQPQAEPLTELDAELERRVPLVAIGHATDDRSPHRSSFVGVSTQCGIDSRRLPSGKDPISSAFPPQC